MNLIIPGLILWLIGSAVGIGLVRLLHWQLGGPPQKRVPGVPPPPRVNIPIIGPIFGPQAVDTIDERGGQINLWMPWRTSHPVADGAIGQADRQHQAWSYPGILAAGAAAGRRTPMTVLSSLPWGPI